MESWDGGLAMVGKQNKFIGTINVRAIQLKVDKKSLKRPINSKML